jgi:hypothetical protein
VPVKRDSHFFSRLTRRSEEEIGVGSIVPTARKPHLPRPRISGALGSPDQQQSVGIGHQHQRHGRPDRIGVVRANRLMQGQLGGNVLEQSVSAGASDTIRRSIRRQPADPGC